MKETNLICALLLSCGAHVDDAGSNSAHTIIFCPLYSALINMANNNNNKKVTGYKKLLILESTVVKVEEEDKVD